MFKYKPKKPLIALVLTTLPLVAVLASSFNANAAENYKLRQTPLGSFGGDIATPADKPGFFGTASLTQITIEGIKGPTGEGLTKSSGKTNVRLDVLNPTVFTGTLIAGVLATVPDGSVTLRQDQTQVNLAGGYLTETTYADGRIAFVANVPFIKQSRTASLSFPNATFSSAIPQTAAAGINAVVQSQALAASNAATGDVSGMGDTELSAVWIRHKDRLKVAAGVSVFVPTGKFDVASDTALRANPGFGDFYTIRPGVAFTYNLNPSHAHQDWDAGVTVAGRLAYGVNTRNKDTLYKSGNFVYSELAIVKVTGDVAFGFNLSATEQVTDDNYSGTDTTKTLIGRYKNYASGPFFSYKFPGQDMGINFQMNRNFSGRNAIDVTSYQLRLIKAF
jgi:hypothetical protein